MQNWVFLKRNIVVLTLVVVLVLSSIVVAVRIGDYHSWNGQGKIGSTLDTRVFNYTNAELQQAIWYSNGSGTNNGKVLLPQGDITLTSDLIIENCSVVGAGSGEGFATVRDGGQTNITLTGGCSIIIRDGGSLSDVCVYDNAGYDTSAIHIMGTTSSLSKQQGVIALSNVRVISDQALAGIGINISAVTDGTGNCAVQLCTFNDVTVENFYYGMSIYADETAGNNAWVNGLSFVNVVLFRNIYPLTIHGVGTAECSGNSFVNFQIQADNSAGTIDAVRIIDNSAGNIFNGLYIWDFTGDTRYSIVCNGTDNYFNGYWYGMNKVQDNGARNSFFSRNEIMLSDSLVIDADINATSSIFQPMYGSDDKLVLYLPFSERTGTYTYDRSLMCNNGYAVASWVDGVAGSAIDFDGATEYVSVADDDSLTPSGNFTMTFWFNADTFDATQDYIIQRWEGAGNQEYLVSTKDSKLKLQTRITGAATQTIEGGILETGVWYFVAWRYDGAKVQCWISENNDYQDYDAGSNKGDEGLRVYGNVPAVAGVLPNTAVNFYLGSYMGTNNYFDGSLDEVRLYNRSLSIDEIRTSYLCGLQSNGYVQSNNFTVFDSNWEPWFKFPTTNCSSEWVAGQSWYDIANHKLWMYEGGTVWKSTTFT